MNYYETQVGYLAHLNSRNYQQNPTAQTQACSSLFHFDYFFGVPIRIKELCHNEIPLKQDLATLSKGCIRIICVTNSSLRPQKRALSRFIIGTTLLKLSYK